MSFYYLITELAVDMLAVILGMILIIRKTDNLPKFYWGIIAVLIGSVFIWENIGWIIARKKNPIYEYTDILNIEKMLEFYVLASLVSLYPLASLNPGYLTKFRIISRLLIPIIIITTGICFLCFNGNITHLESVSHIIGSMNELDVILRLVIFLFTIITPLLSFICPLIGGNNRRKISNMMHFFIAFMFLLLGIYILFTLYICDVFFNGFGAASIAFSIFFSVQYLYKESPLSSYLAEKNEEKDNNEVQVNTMNPSHPTALPLYSKIDDYLRETHAFTDPKYAIESLAKHFEEKNLMISTAIKSGGYSGFREYINYQRLEYFRCQASQNTNKTIKELMYICGFKSRTTFYRLYSERYRETPTEFINKQVNKQIN